MVKPREIVIISPYERITEQLKGIIRRCEPTTTVSIISELNGVIHAERDSVDFGKHYKSLESVDFAGHHWDYDKEPDFGKYIERQLSEVSDAVVEEMMYGHHPSLVIDLEQLAGNSGDVIGVYNIVCFDAWCSQNGVPRLTLPAEVKDKLRDRMAIDPYQGCYTETTHLDSNEQERAEKDLRMVLAGNHKNLLLFQYQAQ